MRLKQRRTRRHIMRGHTRTSCVHHMKRRRVFHSPKAAVALKSSRAQRRNCNVAFKDATRLDSLVLRSSLRATFFSRLSGLFVNRHAFNDHAGKQARLSRSASRLSCRCVFLSCFVTPTEFHGRVSNAQPDRPSKQKKQRVKNAHIAHWYSRKVPTLETRCRAGGRM